MKHRKPHAVAFGVDVNHWRGSMEDPWHRAPEPVVGSKWDFEKFAPMEAIPTSVKLTTYAGEAHDFMRTPLQDFVQEIEDGRTAVRIGKVFQLDEIVEAHRCMEENRAGGKIVVLTQRRGDDETPD